MPYKNKISGIYIITCLYNNKHYIGKSNHCIHRLNQHKNSLRKNKHHSFHLQRAWNKYGEKNFEFSILDTYEEEFLLSMEGYWVNLLNSSDRNFGYNIDIPISNSKHIVNPTTKLKHSNRMKKRKVSEETKQKLSILNKGKTLSKEVFSQLMAAGVEYRKTNKYKEDLIKRKEKVGIKTIIYNISSGQWQKFNTQTDASIFLYGSPSGGITVATNNQRRSIHGYLIFSEDMFDKNKKYKKLKRVYNGNRGKKNNP